MLIDAWPRRFPFYIALACTLGVLFYPLIVLPLYLLVRYRRRALLINGTSDISTAQAETKTTGAGLAVRLAVYLFYVLITSSIYVGLWYRDYHSLDAHLARAQHARLHERTSEAIREYEGALRLKDDAHTRKLLADEFVRDNRWREALEEYRRAEASGERSDDIPFQIGVVLDKLKMPTEAVKSYRKFLESDRCKESVKDQDCEAARVRIG